MTLDIGNTDKLSLFRQELGRLKIRLLAPDINRSRGALRRRGRCRGPAAVRYALAAVRNVGQGAAEGIVARQRAAEAAPFKSLADFARRCDPKALNKRALENLIAAGAFDGLNPNRHQTFQAAEMLLRQAGAAANDRASQQVSLFGGALRRARPAQPAGDAGLAADGEAAP